MEVSCSVWNLPYKANTKSQIILTVKIALIKKKKKIALIERMENKKL